MDEALSIDDTIEVTATLVFDAEDEAVALAKELADYEDEGEPFLE